MSSILWISFLVLVNPNVVFLSILFKNPGITLFLSLILLYPLSLLLLMSLQVFWKIRHLYSKYISPKQCFSLFFLVYVTGITFLNTHLKRTYCIQSAMPSSRKLSKGQHARHHECSRSSDNGNTPGTVASGMALQRRQQLKFESW